jgi:hypothetical protein
LSRSKKRTRRKLPVQAIEQKLDFIAQLGDLFVEDAFVGWGVSVFDFSPQVADFGFEFFDAGDRLCFGILHRAHERILAHELVIGKAKMGRFFRGF